MKYISLLGSTGSVGCSALKIIEKFPDKFKIVGLTAYNNFNKLALQINKFKPDIVAISREEHVLKLEKLIKYNSRKPKIFFSNDGYSKVASYEKANLVLNAMLGSAGLIPTLSAIDAGKDIAMANKEALVMAGELIMAKVHKNKINLIPLDSEHSAIYQCIRGNNKADIREILLTASGGPFLNTPLELFGEITVASALKHPNWSMGNKISIDSATMMNKTLEIIEARWIFNISVEQIKILIHPQSIIHSMVSYKDGVVIGQMGIPDMKAAIAYALSFPNRLEIGVERPDFLKISNLSFLDTDLKKFPCLKLALLVSGIGGTAPIVMNASNEVAVQAFLDGKISFTEIYTIVKETIDSCASNCKLSLQKIINSDRIARSKAASIVVNINKKLI